MTTTQLSPIGRFDKILFANDGSEFSAGAEREAINFARACGSRLYVMSVVRGNPEYDALAPQLAENAEKTALGNIDATKSKAAEANVECEGVLRHGEIIFKEIVDVAEEQQIDVIAIGRRGGRLGLMQRVMGDVTAKVIGYAHCSTLVVPRAARIEGKHILLAVDGSRYSDMAATATANLAKRFNAAVTVVSVVYGEHKENRRVEVEETVKRVSDFMQEEGVNVETRIATGRYANAIVETGQEVGCDLIVVGSHGRTGLDRILLGSVSERVIGLAQCAVLVVKA